jgi:hypothetical protein
MVGEMRSSFRSGFEEALLTGARPRSRSGHGAGRQIPTIKQIIVDRKAMAEEAEGIVCAWRETLDIELNPDHVASHLCALRTWQVERIKEKAPSENLRQAQAAR